MNVLKYGHYKEVFPDKHIAITIEEISSIFRGGILIGGAVRDFFINSRTNSLIEIKDYDIAFPSKEDFKNTLNDNRIFPIKKNRFGGEIIEFIPYIEDECTLEKADFWESRQGESILFYYEPIFHTNGKHWWMHVYSNEFELIRESLGLSKSAHSDWNRFHITIGKELEK